MKTHEKPSVNDAESENNDDSNDSNSENDEDDDVNDLHDLHDDVNDMNDKIDLTKLKTHEKAQARPDARKMSTDTLKRSEDPVKRSVDPVKSSLSQVKSSKEPPKEKHAKENNNNKIDNKKAVKFHEISREKNIDVNTERKKNETNDGLKGSLNLLDNDDGKRKSGRERKAPKELYVPYDYIHAIIDDRELTYNMY